MQALVVPASENRANYCYARSLVLDPMRYYKHASGACAILCINSVVSAQLLCESRGTKRREGTMRMATQKMFRGLVSLSLLLNVCCIGWFMFNGQQGIGPARPGRDLDARRGTSTWSDRV